MNLQILAIRDSAIDAFMQPYFAQSVAAGVRAFGDAVRNPQEGLFSHAEDYSLWHLATFEPGTGLIKPLATPELVVLAVNLKSVAGEGAAPLRVTK